MGAGCSGGECAAQREMNGHVDLLKVWPTGDGAMRRMPKSDVSRTAPIK
jgi:hypothetical protein